MNIKAHRHGRVRRFTYARSIWMCSRSKLKRHRQRAPICVRAVIVKSNEVWLRSIKYPERWAGSRGRLKTKWDGKQAALCFSYHIGYKGSRAARWELCSSPESVWLQERSPAARFLEWWAEEELVEHTGL